MCMWRRPVIIVICPWYALLFTTPSTWDEYQSEVRSGRLEWTPVHTNDGFWKANVQRLNDKNFELLRLLSRILVTSTNPVVLAVACHDIGQYSKWYPQGKK